MNSQESKTPLCVSTSNFLVRNVQLIITTLLESLTGKNNAFSEKNYISISKNNQTKNKGQKEGSRYFILYRIPNCILVPDQPTGKKGDMEQQR